MTGLHSLCKQQVFFVFCWFIFFVFPEFSFKFTDCFKNTLGRLHKKFSMGVFHN